MRIFNLALVLSLTFQFFVAWADDAASPEEFASNNGTSQVLTPDLILKSPTGAPLSGVINTKIEACNATSKTAHTFCLSEFNPKIQAASGMIGVLLSGAMALKSTSQSCQKYSQALKIAEIALAAYNTMCTAAQMRCESSCGEGQKEMETSATQLSAVPVATDGGAAQTDAAVVRTSSKFLIKQLQVCNGYKMNLAAAGVGLMNVLKQSSLSNTCKEATTVADCSKDPTNPACAAAQVDCSKVESQSNIQCVCQRAPNTAGCPGAIGQSGILPTGGGSDGSSSGQSADKINPPNLNGLNSVPGGAGTSAPTGSGGSLAGGGSGGGGGGGSDSLGGANNKAGGADGKKEKMLNPNILSGYEGGGGGGRSGGGRGDSPNSAYNAYLPGGAKDPSRGLASKTSGQGEVTAAGSKSNWEKVSDRYKDNKPSLMGP